MKTTTSAMTPDRANPETTSWVIVDRFTGKPVCETFEATSADLARRYPRYEVMPTLEWLQRINRAIGAGETTYNVD